jgi:F-type H+-transporting ATPase subunit epsilon
MADTLLFQLVSPERLLVETQVTEVQIPAKEGYIGVLPGHAPLLSQLKAGGVLSYCAVDGVQKVVAVYGGFVEVLPDRVRVLADSAENREEIDLSAAQAALKQASADMNNLQGGEADPAVAMDEAVRAQARVDAASAKV